MSSNPYNDAGGFSLDNTFSVGTKERKIGSKNLTPVTCADIALMTGEKFTFGEHQAEQVSLCGVLRMIDMSTTLKVLLVIDDRTGPPVTCQSMDVNDPDLLNLQEGCYVKIFGIIRHVSLNRDEGMKRIINILKIRPCASLNLVSQHMLECSRAKVYYLTTNQRMEASEEVSPGNRMDTTNSALSGANATSFVSETGINGLTEKHDKVYQLIKANGKTQTDNLGIHVNEIISKLAPHGVTEKEAKDAIEFMSSNGHIYQTVDHTYTIAT